jgi:hypothetical protein
MRRWIAGILFVGSIALVTPEAQAGTILPNCATCGAHNTAWDLTLALINDAQNTYSLTVTATYGTPVDFVWVSSIAFKVDAFTNNYQGTPTVTGPIEGLGWGVDPGGINASGCSGSGNGFYCASSNLLGATPFIGGTTDTWVFLLNVNDGVPNFTSGTGSFKAHFTDLFGNKVGSLLSEDVTFGTPVPEPATLVLFGTGLAAAATAIRRRRKV